MNYQYRPSGYGYGKKKKKISGGAVAAVFAMVLVFAAGFLIGNADQLHIFGTASASASKTPEQPGTSGGTVSKASSDAPSAALPDGLHYADDASEPTAAAIGGLDTVTAGSYLVIDRMTGAVLLEKNRDARIYPGATTQIMTAALALEKAGLSDSVNVTGNALGLVGRDSTRIGLQAGETLTMQDALTAMVLGGASDAANAIADTFGYNAFVKEMVARAKDLGCTGTYFVNPNGAQSNAHFTTASDLARMAAHAQKDGNYRAIAGASPAVLHATNVHTADGWAVVQDGSLLSGLQTLLRGSNIVRVTDTQSGVTNQGYTLVCTATAADGTQLLAVLGGLPYDSGKGAARCRTEMAALLEAGATAAASAAKTTVVAAGEPLSEAMSDGVSAHLPVGASLVPETGFALTQTDTMLENGAVTLFGDTSGYTTAITYRRDLQTVLETYRRGTQTAVGTLTVRDASGQAVSDPIAVILK